jgi:uncharacterized membrane protein YfcA
MLPVTPALVATILGSGALAGGLGAMLGNGGGIFLVPFLTPAWACPSAWPLPSV